MGPTPDRLGHPSGAAMIQELCITYVVSMRPEALARTALLHRSRIALGRSTSEISALCCSRIGPKSVDSLTGGHLPDGFDGTWDESGRTLSKSEQLWPNGLGPKSTGIWVSLTDISARVGPESVKVWAEIGQFQGGFDEMEDHDVGFRRLPGGPPGGPLLHVALRHRRL